MPALPSAGALLAKLTAAAGEQGSQEAATIKAFVLPVSPIPLAQRPVLHQLAVALPSNPSSGGINSPRAGAALTVLQPRRLPPPPPLISLDDDEEQEGGGGRPGSSPGTVAVLAQWQQQQQQQGRVARAPRVPQLSTQPLVQAYSFVRLA